MNNFLVAAISVFAIGACVHSPAVTAPENEVAPAQQDWPAYSNATQAGFSEDGLDAVTKMAADGNTQSMVVAMGGKIAFVYGDVALAKDAYIASVRKSILAILYGIYHERDAIDLDKTLADIGFDDIEGLSDSEKTARIRDVIAARSGIYHPASNSSGVTEDDPVRGSHAPGEYYWYNNWDFNAAGAIFEHLAGVDIYTAFQAELVEPLGLQDFDLAAHLDRGKSGDLERSHFPAYHFDLSARDLARIGQLMLQDGVWNDEQIVSAKWVAESTNAITPNAQMNPERYRESGFGYGYMWWVFDENHFPPDFHGGYAARGHFGQYIVVLPETDLVITHKTLPQRYETPEEYEAVNVTWDEMRVLIDLVLNARENQ